MVWIAVVLGVFLFYKFVERSHKIIFFRFVGACLILGALIIGGVFLYEQFETKEKVRADIGVEYANHSSKLSPEIKRKIAERLFSQLAQDSYLLTSFTQEQLLVAKQFYFGYYIDGMKALDNISKADPDEIKFLVQSWSDDPVKSKSGREKYNEIQNVRLQRYIDELPEQRSKFSTNIDRRYFGLLLAARLNSLDDILKSQFESKFTKDESNQVKSFKSEQEDQAEAIMQEFNGLKPNTEISFKVCNKEDKPLNSYYFYVSGFDKGRSSAKALEFEGYGDDTRFEGDIIIPPKQCSDINWTGKYRMFNRYQIKLINGNWGEAS